MDGLARAAAISRALNPVRLAGHEVKFFRESGAWSPRIPRADFSRASGVKSPLADDGGASCSVTY
jgi:hypothetical protein